MTTYIALLRGINVAGQKIIKMTELASCFESMKFKNVKTFIQSGNVIFESKVTDTNKLSRQIEKQLRDILGHNILVFLRTSKDFEKIVKFNPFEKITRHSESRMFVTFLLGEIKPKPKTPLFSVKKDVEIISAKGKELYILSHEVNGRPGFPNNFAEKKFKVSATSRNWRTIKKLSELASN